MTEASPDDDVESYWTDWLACAASWTYAFAHWQKEALRDAARTRVIVQMNLTYFVVSAALVVILTTTSHNDLVTLRRMLSGGDVMSCLIRIVIGSYCLSRCIEVSYAFVRDAFAKLAGSGARSDLKGRRRIRLALTSYAELIMDFGVLYAVLPADAWQTRNANPPGAVTDALFYSASTITTSGGGGFVPEGGLLQALTAFEIGCGLILLVVCFAVYASRPSD